LIRTRSVRFVIGIPSRQGCIIGGPAEKLNSTEATMLPDGIFTATIANDKWSLNFAKGKFTVSRAAQIVVEGSYKVTDDVLELTDEKGPFASLGDRKTGKYRWKITDGQLKFTRVDDPSEGRIEVLTGQSWIAPNK